MEKKDYPLYKAARTFALMQTKEACAVIGLTKLQLLRFAS